MKIFALSCNFRTAELSVLERLSLSRERVAELYAAQTFSGFSECVLLSTCNRVELYVAGTQTSAEAVAGKLAEISGVSAEEILTNAKIFSDSDAVRHLFEVASGLDSRMVGEAEILGQVKQAYEAAFAAGTTGVALNRIFQKSFQAAKWARANTGISQGQISVGNVAVELAGRVFGDLARCAVLVVGTGDAGRKTAQAFVSRGAGNVLVASRNFERARALAAEIGAGAVELDSVAARAVHADIVVGCASVSEPLISEKMLRDVLRSRGDRPLFLIDLGMPRNFPDGVESDDLWVYGLADLAAIANENLSAREREAALCREELSARSIRLFEKL
ncbi:MAG: glutamyl-tRNA reductase [Opitutales bacterium]|nr:glutamyl-tRNA reductase [Opitutales bacterium]